MKQDINKESSVPALYTPVYKSLDAWRGVAALWVVGTHATGLLQSGAFPTLQYNLLSRLLSNGIYGVEIFFVVSGYCIAAALNSSMKRENAFASFCIARVRRIFPTYIAAIVFTLMISFIWRFFHPSADLAVGYLHPATVVQPWYTYLSNISLTQLIFNQPLLLPIAWTLCYELAFYFICAAFMLLFRRQGATGALRGLYWLTLATAAVMALNYKILFFPLDLWTYFGAGVLLFGVLTQPNPRRTATYLGGVLAFLIVFMLRHKENICFGTHNPLRSALVVIVAVVLIGVLRRWDAVLSSKKIVQFMAYIGLFSYSLYLVHYNLIGISLAWSEELVSKMNWVLAIAVFVVLPTFVAWLFFLAFERPFLKKRVS